MQNRSYRSQQAALEAKAKELREAIDDVLAGTGFQLDVDRFGDGGILLRHFKPGSTCYDYETPLEGESQ